MLVKHVASARVRESPNTQKQCGAVVHSGGWSMAAEATTGSGPTGGLGCVT